MLQPSICQSSFGPPRTAFQRMLLLFLGAQNPWDLLAIRAHAVIQPAEEKGQDKSGFTLTLV